MKKSLITDTIILTISGFLAKAVGFAIRVYISNKIGSEGMGMFSMVSSIYMLFATIATSGISISVSKLCAEEISKGNTYSARKIVRLSCLVMGLVGLIAFVVLFLSSNFIGITLLKDIRTILSIKLISIGLPFISITSCINGYFFASRNIVKPATSQILEQIVKIISVYLLFLILLPKGLEYGLAAVVLSITIADFFVCIYQFILYKLYKTKIINKSFSLKNTVKKLVSISFPLAINSYLNSGLRLIENLIIPFSLRKFGQTFSQSLSTYGMLKGMVMPILIFPSAFLSSLANILVPAIASAKINNDLVKLNKTISKILQLTLLIGILLVGIFMSFSNDISMILYHNIECGKMLFSLSFICPFLYFDMIIVAILNGLSEQITCLKVNLIEALIRIAIIFFIIPIIGINGFLFAIGLSSIFSAILYLRKLISITNIKFDFINYILKPILSASVVLLSTRFLYKTLTITTIYPSIGLIIGIVISCVIYLILIILLGCIDKKDFIFLLYTIKKKK